AGNKTDRKVVGQSEMRCKNSPPETGGVARQREPDTAKHQKKSRRGGRFGINMICERPPRHCLMLRPIGLALRSGSPPLRGGELPRRRAMYRTLALSALLMLPAVALAHHGGAEYDLGKTVEFKGKLTRVDLINPHSWLYFDVTEKDGKVSLHRCEMRSVHVLRRSGWTK